MHVMEGRMKAKALIFTAGVVAGILFVLAIGPRYQIAGTGSHVYIVHTWTGRLWLRGPSDDMFDFGTIGRPKVELRPVHLVRSNTSKDKPGNRSQSLPGTTTTRLNYQERQGETPSVWDQADAALQGEAITGSSPNTPLPRQ